MKKSYQVVLTMLAFLSAFVYAQDEKKVKILLVTNETWGEGDSAVLDRMQSQGYDVLTGLDSDVDSTWADGMDLVYVSSTVSSSKVTNKFKNVAVPVIMIEPYAQDDMGMTLDTDAMRHFQPKQRPLVIRAEGHFLAAGLTGEVEPFDFYEIQSGQGYPNEEGVVIAEYVPVPGDEEIATIIYGAIYCYEKGAVMADGTEAAERRYFAGWNDNGAAYFNDIGWKLWQASIDWCLYKDKEQTKAEKPAIPMGMALHQNYPNPFNPTTSIEFEIASAGRVQLALFDLNGRKLAELVDGYLPAGAHRVDFDASALSAGVYVYELTADNHKLNRKMTLLK
ncbi:MAG: T9SS type A sorting domain-containing protein [candidate division KSB1 bacterium]|nr:T9SS type A sorting domain-containing protein [candidate division KSB1 bacterium]